MVAALSMPAQSRASPSQRSKQTLHDRMLLVAERARFDLGEPAHDGATRDIRLDREPYLNPKCGSSFDGMPTRV